MKTSLVLSVATLLVATSPTYAIDVPTSTAKVKSAQQFKEETTKHYDKMYFLSEVKLKQQKTNRDKAKVACVEIPKAISDAIKFNNVNKSLFDEATRKKIDEHNSKLMANNQTMYINLKCDDAIKHYKLPR